MQSFSGIINSVYTLNSGSYLPHLPPPYVPLSNMYILSLQVHISQISHRRMSLSQIFVYPHSSAYLPHLPPRCVPLVRVYLFSWCLSCCCVYVSLLTRASKIVSQTSTNLLKRLEKESSPPLFIPFFWMHSLPLAHPAHRPAHRRTSSVCICPRC